MTAPIPLTALEKPTLAELHRRYEETTDAETHTRYQMLFLGRVAVGRTADAFCQQIRAAVARSKQRGRLAIVIADNLKTHTSAGSLLVRSMLTELKEYLCLVYTPADPDANRIEWLWRISRRVVTHNHHRSTFDLLLADLETHFQTLAHTPTEVLRHIGSPFAPEKDQGVPLSLAQAT